MKQEHEQINKKTESEQFVDLEAKIVNLIKQIEQKSTDLQSKENVVRQAITAHSNSNDEVLKQAAINLSSYFTPSRNSPLSPQQEINQAKDLSTLFRKVRNRLFHGGKIHDQEGSDAELLNKLNPLLIEIVEILQKH